MCWQYDLEFFRNSRIKKQIIRVFWVTYGWLHQRYLQAVRWFRRQREYADAVAVVYWL